MDQSEKAHEYAANMEEIGMDVRISAPSSPETLSIALGANQDSLNKLAKEIDDEIDSHGSCCFKESEAEQPKEH